MCSGQARGLEQLPSKVGRPSSQLFLTQLFPGSLILDPAEGERLQIPTVHLGPLHALRKPTNCLDIALAQDNCRRVRKVLEDSSNDLIFQSMDIRILGETEFSGLGQ